MLLFPLGGLHFGRRDEFWLQSENLDFKADIHQRRVLEIPESFPTICHKRCSPTQTNPFLQKEPLTVLLSDLNEFSLQDFLFRWHYHKKLAYTITCGQWRLTGLSQTVSDPPRTGKYCRDLTLWSFSHLHLAARCSGSAGVPCPVFLGTVGAAMVFVVGCNGCQGGSCSMGAPGKGYREFVSLSDIQVHRIIAKHHLFYRAFSFPSDVTFQHSFHGYIIHYDSLGRMHLRSVQDSEGFSLHLLALSTAKCCPAYVMWLRIVLVHSHCIILYLLQNYYTQKFRPLYLYY